MNHDPNLQTPNGLGSDYPLPSQYERSPNTHSASSSKGGNNVHHNGFSNHGHNHSNGSGNGNGSGMPYPLPDANGQYPPPTWNSYTSSMAPYGTPMHQQFSPSMPPPHHLPPHQLPPFDYIGGSRSAPHLYSGSTRVNGQYVSPTDSRFTTSPFSPMVPLEHLGSYGSGSGSGSGMPPPHPTPYPSRAPVRTPNTRRDERLAATRAGPSQQAGGIRRSASENSEDMSWDGMNNKDEAFDDDSPWGMPQEVYKALPAKEKKQVRNKVGARKFRTKRKCKPFNPRHSMKVYADGGSGEESVDCSERSCLG
jgi:hypothetical protein